MRSFLLLLAIAIAAQAPTPPGAPPVCYAVRLSAGPAGDPAEWGRVHVPPDTIALDSVLLSTTDGLERYQLRPGIHRRYWPGREPTWWLQGDTLKLHWSDGLTGVRVTALLAEGGFTGEATLVTDVKIDTPLPRAIAEGTRVHCPPRLIGPTQPER